ncbi:unnamed protein product [marine sediment metagenome]|uniref:Uncharacterized protein n=1 Tax=marine sediment metagenome TaxID=412755 RepID=X0VKN7_9ZZZZ
MASALFGLFDPIPNAYFGGTIAPLGGESKPSGVYQELLIQIPKVADDPQPLTSGKVGVNCD